MFHPAARLLSAVPRVRHKRGGRVQVRRGSHGLELRVDGSLASVHRPRGAAGAVWQALALPALALRPARRRSALILGLGGASVVRLLRELAPGMRIVGVERDADVIVSARRHLGLDELGIDVVHADALNYLDQPGPRFDLIVEDLFVGDTRRLAKPPGFPVPGLSRAARRRNRGGVLVSNSVHEGPDVARVLRGLGETVVSIAVRGYYNRVFASGPRTLAARTLRAALGQTEILDASQRLQLHTLQS